MGTPKTFKNMDALNKELDTAGVKDREFYQCMECPVIQVGIPVNCRCGNTVDNRFAKVLVNGKDKQGVNDNEPSDGWNAYKRQDSPHFKDVKEWLAAVDEIGIDNKNKFYFCEGCEGIFVYQFPFTCSCGNNLEEAFKEIDGQMRKQLIAGKTLKELNKYSYLQ